MIVPAPTQFQRAAALALDALNGLCAGDALHLACAEQVDAKTFATLDGTQARSAQLLGPKLVAFR